MKRLTRWFPLLILAAGIMAYANSFPGPFIFDDARVVVNNPRLYSLWPPWKAVLIPTRFVADLSFAANFALSGMTPADYRMTNVLIHILAGWLLYGVVRRTLNLPRFRDTFGAASAPLGFAVSLLWVVHPLQTESVTYIAQRIEALMGLFFLLVFYCFVRGLGSPRPRTWMNASLAACAVGMGTKEVMVTAPFMVLLFDVMFGAPSWRQALRERWKVHTALFLTLGIFLMLFVLATAQAMAEGGMFEEGIRPWTYACTQAGVILHYFRLAFVPTSLCLSYRWPFAQSLAEVWQPASVLLVLGLVTVAGLVRRKAFAFPLAWVFVILAPTSTFLPLSDAAFEHRMYLPLAGVITLVVVGTYALAQRFPQRSAWSLGAAIVVLAFVGLWFTVLTRDRNLDYRSQDAIWRDVIKKRPDNYKIHIAMSGALIGANKLDEAETLLTNLFARLPDFSKVPFEELQRQYLKNPSLPCVEYAMGRNNLGVVYLSQARWDAAKAQFRESMRVYPANHIGYFNMGRVALFQGHTNDAIGWWKISLLKKKDDTDCLCLLASHHALLGDYANAVRYYRAALFWKPDHPFARTQLAWTLATCPDGGLRNGAEAVVLARTLPAMTGGTSARAFDVLAAAQAEAGHFGDAVSCAAQALDLARKKGPGSETEQSEIAQRLETYRQGRPYHTNR